ncbi:DUF397 domain-containing protein [Streptomyces sp. NPDC048636]|uniref:DUF397 domain-containing protein n=1 Tax=Streptomyces sp. NPDC048636 TaxID=3155762 RepID=UPI00343AC46F
MERSPEWRKSSYSGDVGNSECVECAPLGGLTWRKSSYSEDQGECVEVAETANHRVAVRDSKNPHGPTLLLSPAAFADFVTATATGTL